jgi:hypothetical protein
MAYRNGALRNNTTAATSCFWAKRIFIMTGLFFFGCSDFKQDNPLDTSGINWHPPTLSLVKPDTIVWMNDTVHLWALGTDENGTIASYKWSFPNNINIVTQTGAFDTTFATTGKQAITVIAYDNDNVPSMPHLMTIDVRNKPSLSVSRTSLTISPSMTSDTFSIINNGYGSLPWTITDDADWMSVIPSSGNTVTGSSVVNVTFNRSGLKSGIYTGTISVVSGGEHKDILVTMQSNGYNYTFVNQTDCPLQCFLNGILTDTIPANDSITIVRQASTNTRIPVYLKTIVATGKYLSWNDTLMSMQDFRRGYIVGSNSWFLLRLTNNTNKIMRSVAVSSGGFYDSSAVYVLTGTTKNIGYYTSSSSTAIRVYYYSTTSYHYWASLNTIDSSATTSAMLLNLTTTGSLP